MAHHLLIVPSLSCPAACSYCFGPHSGGARMRQATLAQTADWLSQQAVNETLEVTFHGGEPLLAGADFFRAAIPLLRDAWQGRQVRFSVQSNLWRLDADLLDVFAEHPVALGTSLDGPKEINDAQRGPGYFERTMHGIELARTRGIPVGCIATFTAQSAPRWREVVDFFLAEGLGFSLHAALPVLGHPAVQPWQLSPEGYGALLSSLLDFYLDNLKRMRVETLDALIRSVSAGKGGMCTFGDCLGAYLAVGPDGSVYPCQRFCGDSRFRLGGVDEPSEALRRSAVWAEFARRQEKIEAECAGCAFLDICRGGCPYNVLVASGGTRFNGSLRDPYCPAYRSIFTTITERATAEAFATENLREVVDRPEAKRGMLRKGPMLELMSKRPHPSETAQNARQALAAVALAADGTPEGALRRLQSAGLVQQPQRTLAALEGLSGRLNASRTIRNNIYLHVTYACPLSCAHCYAEGGASRKGAFAVGQIEPLARQAAQLGFRHLVITGGEPLVHPNAKKMLKALAQLREGARPLRTVLRTSLVTGMDEKLLGLVANSTDEVVVSIDGDDAAHDERRGAGSHARTTANLRRLVACQGRAEISLAAVLPLQEAQGEAGRAVRALAEELGIRRVRFRPVLPLGRAAEHLPGLEADVVWSSLRPEERLAYGFMPAASCGMGQNVYIEPDGAAYPCYAWHGENWKLGLVTGDGGLAEVVASGPFLRLGQATVNSNRACRSCGLRYLCGGACRAWNRLEGGEQADLDAPPVDCTRLKARARGVLLSALNYLEVPTETWLSAGLPID